MKFLFLQNAKNQSDLPEAGNYAALDLGSNSFHLLIVREENGSIQIVDQLKLMVRLGEGLGEDKRLSQQSLHQGLEALAQMAQRMHPIPAEQVRVVATNTLRVAKNGDEFLQAGEKVLNYPIEIINGMEEARLIHLGITQYNHIVERCIIIDIGGGSTEIIIGEAGEPLMMRSFPMGCANMAQRFFADGVVNENNVKKACLQIGQNLEPYAKEFRQHGWQRALFSSGTAKAVERCLSNFKFSESGIAQQHVGELLKMLIDIGQSRKFSRKLGIGEERAFGFAGGVCIMHTVMSALGINEAEVSQQALREGVILDLVGRKRDHDERFNTVNAMSKRFSVDTQHAAQVKEIALYLFDSLAAQHLGEEMQHEHRILLAFAAELHEIGMAVAYSNYHKHSAYLIANSTMPGFSSSQQKLLAAILLEHRKSINLEAFQSLSQRFQSDALVLCLILRLAVILCRARDPIAERDRPFMNIEGKEWQLRFPQTWLQTRPLTQADLINEQQLWQSIGLNLHIDEGKEA